jgi:hypothetical protein
MERANKNAMMALHLPTGEVELDGIGSVLVRGLSRFEMIEVQKLEDDRQVQDTLALHYGMVEPEMSEEEVIAWRKAGAVMEIESVARKINALSGIGKDAAKSDVPADGEDGPGV